MAVFWQLVHDMVAHLRAGRGMLCLWRAHCYEETDWIMRQWQSGW